MSSFVNTFLRAQHAAVAASAVVLGAGVTTAMASGGEKPTVGANGKTVKQPLSSRASTFLAGTAADWVKVYEYPNIH